MHAISSPDHSACTTVSPVRRLQVRRKGNSLTPDASGKATVAGGLNSLGNWEKSVHHGCPSAGYAWHNHGNTGKHSKSLLPNCCASCETFVIVSCAWAAVADQRTSPKAKLEDTARRHLMVALSSPRCRLRDRKGAHSTHPNWRHPEAPVARERRAAPARGAHSVGLTTAKFAVFSETVAETRKMMFLLYACHRVAFYLQRLPDARFTFDISLLTSSRLAQGHPGLSIG
jgi:hypothetical protein